MVIQLRKRYNYLGEDITACKIQVCNPIFGYVDNYNIPHINWGTEDDICDSNGFDKRYMIKVDHILQPGTVICRYGSP